MAANDSTTSVAPRRVTSSGPRLSAIRPAMGAASAPAAPARPKAPAAALPRWKGAPCSITASVDQKALKPTASSPCARAARRSAACCRHSWASEPISAPYPSCVVGTKRGSPRQVASPTSAMLAAATKNMARQPQCSATKPLTTRDNKMPSSSPVITVPTTLPRCASGARVAAAGTMSCASVAARPTARLATSSSVIDGAMPASNSATHNTAALARMMRRRSYRSPSGASSSRPSAYPSWVSVGTRPMARSDAPMSGPSTPSMGWA